MKKNTVLMLFIIYLYISVLSVEIKPTSARSSARSSARVSTRYSSRTSSRGNKAHSWYGGGSTTSYSGVLRSSFSRNYKLQSLSLGMLYASTSWKLRYGFGTSNAKNDDISICFNIQDPLPQEFNSTVVKPWYYRSKVVLGLFVCPLTDDEAMNFCCGDEDAEYCCTFWNDVQRVIGVISIIIFGLVVIVAAIIFFKIHIKIRDFWKKNVDCLSSSTNSQPSYTPNSASNRAEATRTSFASPELLESNPFQRTTKETTNDDSAPPPSYADLYPHPDSFAMTYDPPYNAEYSAAPASHCEGKETDF